MQSYGEQTSTGGSAYSSTLSTSASVSSNSTSNSTGPAVLSASLNSASTHPAQPSKPSVPGLCQILQIPCGVLTQGLFFFSILLSSAQPAFGWGRSCTYDFSSLRYSCSLCPREDKNFAFIESTSEANISHISIVKHKTPPLDMPSSHTPGILI